MDVVRHTMLRTFDRIFFGEDAGDQEKGGVVTGLAQVGESVETSPPGQRVSSEDCGKFLRGERGFKVRTLFNDSGLDGYAGVAEFAKNEAASCEECSSNRTRRGAASKGDSSCSAEADFMRETQASGIDANERKEQSKQNPRMEWQRKAKTHSERTARELGRRADFQDRSGK